MRHPFLFDHLLNVGIVIGDHCLLFGNCELSTLHLAGQLSLETRFHVFDQSGFGNLLCSRDLHEGLSSLNHPKVRMLSLIGGGCFPWVNSCNSCGGYMAGLSSFAESPCNRYRVIASRLRSQTRTSRSYFAVVAVWRSA